jgi:hypothetical protein
MAFKLENSTIDFGGAALSDPPSAAVEGLWQNTNACVFVAMAIERCGWS